jgi:predicted Rossmann fold flavoprotein
MAKTILNELDIDHAIQPNKLNTKEIKKIVNKIQNFRFEVKETHGFRHAEVSGGGVDTSEIDPKTLKSKKQKNLYFCGEVLDVVGRRGGFNFAWAWASGHLVAKNINIVI